jgi:hypothetical protein
MNNTVKSSATTCETLAFSFRHVVWSTVWWLMFWPAAGVAIDGCALHFADNGSALPSSAKTVYVARFENMTYVSGINDEFMRYMKDAISSRGRLVVVDDPAQADLLLTGKVLYAGTGLEV